MSEIASIDDAAAALRARRVSATELAATADAALARLDPELHLLVAAEPDRATAQATSAQAAIDRGNDAPLVGVPMAHKDMFYRAGRISACGSAILAAHRPTTTATVLERLDARGAVDVGRLQMVELALGVTGHNVITGTPRNPWDPDRITGGSSSASAAAVAAGCVFAALGSDTGGSIRIPASCCGLVGLKPTYGRVSRFGAMPLAGSLDHVGALCRTVRDAALMLQALAGHDPNDPLSVDTPVPDYLEGLESGVAGSVLAVPQPSDLAGVAAPVLAAFDEAMQVFERLGCRLRPVSLDWLDPANDVATVTIGAEAAAVHATAMKERPEAFGAQTLARMRSGLFIPATRYLQAQALRARLLDEVADRALCGADALLVPALETPVPTIAESDVGANPGFQQELLRFARWFRPFNVLGLPALAMPIGTDTNGLPIAAQLVGHPFAEARVLQVARSFERATALTGRRPRVAAGALW